MGLLVDCGVLLDNLRSFGILTCCAGRAVIYCGLNPEGERRFKWSLWITAQKEYAL